MKVATVNVNNVNERMLNLVAWLKFSKPDVVWLPELKVAPGQTRGGMDRYRSFAADHAAALQYKKQPLAIPVLALGGDQRFGSRMVPMLREFASNVTGGSIDRCSHYVADERPDEVAAALIGFLTAN